MVMTTMTTRMTKPFLRLTTYGIYHGVAACRIDTLVNEHWHSWGLQHVIAEDWYMFHLFCLLNLADGVIIVGANKLQEWRLSYDNSDTATV